MPNPLDPTQPQRPEYPKSPEQPVVPPDDPHRPDVEREPNIDPPPTAPPIEAPSERPVISEPPSPRAQPAAMPTNFPALSSFAWIAAVAISVATLPAQQADNVTVQLRNGQVVRGGLEDLEGGTLYVRVTRDDQRRLPIGEVALIDRVGGASGLPETELREARNPEHLAILTSGGSVIGKLVDIAGGPGSAAGEEGKERRFIFQLPDGSQRSVPGNDIGRVYLGSYSLQGGATAALPEGEGQAPSGAIRVPGNGQWIPTPYRVRRGQRLGFNATGQVRLSVNPDDVASPAGGSRMAPEAPVPNAPAGALIGRIGEDGAPFPIGNQPAVQMPGDGMLYLSVNDGERSDNGGVFTVLIDPRSRR
jgi:hypothetical protein